MGERFRELPSKIGIHVWQKNVKNYATLQSERTASIAFQNQSDKTLFVIHEKKTVCASKRHKNTL